MKDLQQYAIVHPQLPKADNTNWVDLDYSTFHKSLYPNFLQRTAHKVGIKNQQLNRVEKLKQLLEKVVLSQKKKGLPQKYIAYMSCIDSARFAIMGDLQGSFHALVRMLTWTYSKNMINGDLKIINPNYYFVFNGNSIDGSAYALETLHLILLLMHRNPEKIIYIRGQYEHENYWHNLGLERELQIRAAHLSDETIPLGSLVSTFFDTLPYALYISSKTSPSELIKIVHAEKAEEELDEILMGKFLTQCHDTPIAYYDITNKRKTSRVPDIRAIITTQNLMIEQITQQGLGLLEQEHGATVWALFSSPISTHRGKLELHFDSFALLDIKDSITNSTITLFNRKAQAVDKKFKRKGIYNIANGMQLDRETRKTQPSNEFYLGSTMGLITGVPSMARRVKQGMLIRIKEANQEGGVNGTHLRVFIKNDNYTPHIARRNMSNFIKDYGIDTFLLPTGSPTLHSYLDYVRENKILVLFPITGSPAFRTPELSSLINYRASYPDEVKAMLEYLIQEYDTSNFAFFYQDDAYGQGAFKTAQQVLEKIKGKKVIAIPYKRAEVIFGEQIKEMKKHPVDAIGFFSASQPTQEFIREIGVEYLANKQLFCLSFLAEEAFRHFLQKKGLNMIFGSVVPNPETSNLEIVQDYRNTMKKNYYETYDTFSLEAYIATSILIDVMEQITQPITRQKIAQQLKTFNNYQFKGLDLTFDPITQSLSQHIWIEDGYQKKWIKRRIDTKKKTQE